MSVKESPGGGRFKQSEGDWTCSDPSCGNVNFARRSECNKCGASKTVTPSIIKKDGTLVKKGGHEIGKQMAEKSKGLFSADDWQCKSCGNVNWARRMTCNVCNAPKYGKVEQRTGYGGGFMERDEVVEYKEKIENDDDGDYDEFGRLRKGKRGKLPIVQSLKEITPAPVPVPDDDDEEDDDDDDGDVSKYMLESDDDEDVDLSKYALSDDSDIEPKTKTENKSSNNNKKSSRSKSRSRSRSYSSSSSSSSSRSTSPKRRRRSDSRSRSRSKSRDKHHKRRRSSSSSRSRSRSPKRRTSDSSNRSRH